MLFQGWSVEKKGQVGNPWQGHPFNKANNINGIDGDLNGDGQGPEIHTLDAPTEILERQQAYVRQVVDTVNDLDNVLYEIGNEMHVGSVKWQYRMIEYIREYERSKPKQHPDRHDRRPDRQCRLVRQSGRLDLADQQGRLQHSTRRRPTAAR